MQAIERGKRHREDRQQGRNDKMLPLVGRKDAPAAALELHERRPSGQDALLPHDWRRWFRDTRERQRRVNPEDQESPRKGGVHPQLQSQGKNVQGSRERRRKMTAIGRYCSGDITDI